jgi:hypothetical protein
MDLRQITVDYIQKGVVLPKPPVGVHAVEHAASSFACHVGYFFNNNVFRKKKLSSNNIVVRSNH